MRPLTVSWYLQHTRLLVLTTTLLCSYGVSQSPIDEQASFNTAIAQTEPQARTRALEAFLRDYPDGAKYAAAQQLLLEAYLATVPEPTSAIRALVTAEVQAAPAGPDRWSEQARLANLLADAGDHGVDLEDAQTWAETAVQSITEPAYRQQMLRTQLRYKLPALTPAQLHAQFAADRSTCLLALANVLLRRDQPQRAAPLVTEAVRLNPLSSEGHRLLGELALAQGHKDDALSALVQADALGPLPLRWREREETLFVDTNPGNKAALEDRVDAAYRALYPPLFALPKRQLASGGHTVLLELFTGSDCAPCAGPDLAVDSLLGTYSRSDLIALEFDEHIPRPDPLATPDTAARADFYTVASTPSAFLDGQPAQLLGSSRRDVGNIVVSLADRVEDAATLPSGLHLSIAADWTGTGVLSATVSLGRVPSSAAPVSDTTGDTSLRTLGRAVLYVALVEDGVHYPGSNGVRFHRMVVRALQQTPASAFLAGAASRPVLSFDPAGLQTQQTAYLSEYESHSNRFGAFRFPVTDIPIRRNHLALAAWVQDPVTHHVLQSVFMATPPSE